MTKDYKPVTVLKEGDPVFALKYDHVIGELPGSNNPRGMCLTNYVKSAWVPGTITGCAGMINQSVGDIEPWFNVAVEGEARPKLLPARRVAPRPSRLDR